jgi:TatD DNase family protein
MKGAPAAVSAAGAAAVSKNLFQTLKSPAPLVDIGINLGHRDFSKDFDKVIERSVSSNVTTLICTGTSVKSTKAVQKISKKKFPPGVEVFFTAGIHPHDAKTFSEEAKAVLRKCAEDERCKALGEMGIDFDRNFSTPKDQMKAFEEQLKLAVELKKPVFLHQREGFKEFNTIMDRVWPKERANEACVHCFTGSAEELRQYVEKGYMVGITGFVCNKKRAEELRKALQLKILPLEQLMIETDGPFMSPRNIPKVPRRCEPAMLSYVAKELAELLDASLEDLCFQTTKNAQRFFNL